MDDNFFSVVIPVYNKEPHIASSLSDFNENCFESWLQSCFSGVKML